MSQDEIIKLLEKEKVKLTASQIINELRVSDESKEFIRTSLKKLREHNEVSFLLVGVVNKEKNLMKVKFTDDDKIKWTVVKKELLYKKYPELRGKKITRNSYLYFIK